MEWTSEFEVKKGQSLYTLRLPQDNEIRLYFFKKEMNNCLQAKCVLYTNSGSELSLYYDGDKEITVEEAKEWAEKLTKDYFDDKIKYYQELRAVFGD